MPRRSRRRWMMTLLAATTVLAACAPAAGKPSEPVVLELTPRSAATVEIAAPAPTASGPASNADVIFHNGVLLTMDDSLPTASAIHIVGDSIASVGDDAAILAEAGPATRIVDLDGRTLMPGFVDTHSHMFAEPDPDVVQDTLLRTGVTTTAEMYVDPPLLERLVALDSAGGLRVRLSAYMIYDTACGEPLGDWWREHPATRVPGEMLRIGGVKVFTDGGSCNAPAVTFEYANGVGQGDLYFTQPELEAVLKSIDEAGHQAAVHAIGDRALDVVLGAFENLWGGANPRRHRIEHNAVVRPDQLTRFSSAQPVATIFAPFATCHKLGGETRFKYEVPDEQRAWEWPWRDLIDANPGVHFAWHGDMPHVYPPDMAYQLWAMVPRAEMAADGSICEPPDWIAHNALTVDEVLHLMTIDAAYALDRDQEVGSLVPGKYADLILLSEDPRTAAAESLKDLRVLMTMVGGAVANCAEGMQALCPPAAPAESAELPPVEAPVVFRDDFDGALDPAWSWTNEDPSAWSLTANPGWLTIALSQGGFLTTTPANLLLQPSPTGDFDLRTTVSVAPSRNFEFAGLIVTFPDGEVLQIGRGYCDVPGGCIGEGFYFDHFRSGSGIGGNFGVSVPGGPENALRLQREGSTYTAYYLSPGGEWFHLGSHVVDRPPASVGLIAAQAQESGSTAEFDSFEIRAP